MTAILPAPRPINLPGVVAHGDTPLGLAFRNGLYLASNGVRWFKVFDGWFPDTAAITHDAMARLIETDTRTLTEQEPTA